jgi:hypothetical protein
MPSISLLSSTITRISSNISEYNAASCGSSPLRPDAIAGPRLPTQGARYIALTLAGVPVPEEIAILVNGHDDMTESSEIGHASENMSHVLPAVPDRVSRVGVPAEGSRRVMLALAAV